MRRDFWICFSFSAAFSRSFALEVEREVSVGVEVGDEGDFGVEAGYRTSHNVSSAVYAAGRISRLSPKGVRVGSQDREGKMASSNTESRPDCSRILLGRRGRKVVLSFRPRTRMWVELSSRRVRRGGIRRDQWAVMSSSWKKS